MPIKFRCPHCRQFLGISPSQAGLIVDCPTCGRAVRVPYADGRVEPLPPPELDARDIRLQHALEELALIGAGPLRSKSAGTPFADSDAPAASDSVENTLKSLDPTPHNVRPPLNSASPSEQPVDIVAELAKLAEAEPKRAVAHIEPEPDSRPRPALLVAIAILVFVAGCLAGWAVRTASAVRPQPDEAARVPGQRPDKRRDPPEAGAPVIRGRITYRTVEGDSRPDRGARVFVFPESHDGDKLQIADFQADDPARSAAALAALRSMGGDLAVADDEGEFEIRLPSAGVYTILAISNYQPRAADQPIEPSVQSLLEKFFDRPERVLGTVQYRAGQIRSAGHGTLWDHSFERS